MKIAALARQARESLGRGLEALQRADAPERLLEVAQPLAKAMGTLIEMEVAPPDLARKAADSVLLALREALALLQLPENLQLSVADAAMTAVAQALGHVHQISEDAARGAKGKAQFAGTQHAGAPAAAAAAKPAAKAPAATLGVRPGPAAAAKPAAKAPTTARAAATNLPLRAVEAALGAHSATNFYKGLAGGDVVASGGLFVATYQAPDVGQPLLLKVTMPGGYEFEAKGVVAWRRDIPASSAAAAEAPGFGAQFSEISDEGRSLIQRYVRNREPLFHDDA